MASAGGGVCGTAARRCHRRCRVRDGHDGAAVEPGDADGVLPQLISEAGFSGVREVEVIPTINGSIPIYVARKLPAQQRKNG